MRSRRPWSNSEIQATVNDYKEMLEAESAGRPYSKTEHRRDLVLQLDNRSGSAVEMKHRNISAVLEQAGMRRIAGYAPLGNYQRELADEVLRAFTRQDN